jgi:hypothetical protein
MAATHSVSSVVVMWCGVDWWKGDDHDSLHLLSGGDVVDWWKG